MIYEYVNLAAFPATGDPDAYYKALDTGLIYSWVNGVYLLYKTVPIDLDWIDASTFLEINGHVLFKAVPWQSRTNLLEIDLSSYTDLEDTDVVLIQSSMVKHAGWEVCAKITKATHQFLDHEANTTLYLNGPKYYRLVFPRLQTKTTVHNVYGDIDKIGAEIAYRNYITLSKGRNGNLCYAFIKHRDGIRCQNCWDEILQQRIAAECTYCLSTGWLWGFYDPIPVYVSFNPNTISLTVELEGQNNSGSRMQAWTGNYPLLSNGDIIIEDKSAQVWGIDSVQQSTHRRVVTRQNLNLSAFQGDDPKLELIKRLNSKLLKVTGRI